MEKEGNPQLELFSLTGNKLGLGARIPHRPFFCRLRRYEKAVLVIMGMLISGIVSFSLGVEKGKRLAQARSSPSRATYVPPAAVKNAIIEEERVVPPAQATIITASGYYTIQLASYKSSACAKREAEALKRKGLAPIILKKGNYIVLCVGNFPSKETARSLMPQLAPRYRGCYIRRL